MQIQVGIHIYHTRVYSTWSKGCILTNMFKWVNIIQQVLIIIPGMWCIYAHPYQKFFQIQIRLNDWAAELTHWMTRWVHNLSRVELSSDNRVSIATLTHNWPIEDQSKQLGSSILFFLEPSWILLKVKDEEMGHQRRWKGVKQGAVQSVF